MCRFHTDLSYVPADTFISVRYEHLVLKRSYRFCRTSENYKLNISAFRSRLIIRPILICNNIISLSYSCSNRYNGLEMLNLTKHTCFTCTKKCILFFYFFRDDLSSPVQDLNLNCPTSGKHAYHYIFFF